MLDVMMRPSTLVLVSIVICSAPVPAAAWVASGSVGMGIVVGRLGWDGPTSDQMDEVHLSDSLVATTVGIDGFLGTAITDNVSLGLELDLSLIVSGKGELA